MSLRIKQGDTYPFQYVISYEDNTPIDLSGATVTVTICLDGETDPTVDAASCTIVNATSGIIQYSWQEGETDITGMYRIEFRITFNSGAILTVPSNDILWLNIIKSTKAVVI